MSHLSSGCSKDLLHSKYFLQEKRTFKRKKSKVYSAVCNYFRREAINWLKERKQYMNNLNIIRTAVQSVWPQTYLHLTDHTPCQIHTDTRTHRGSNVILSASTWGEMQTVSNNSEQPARIKAWGLFLNSHHTTCDVLNINVTPAPVSGSSTSTVPHMETKGFLTP